MRRGCALAEQQPSSTVRGFASPLLLEQQGRCARPASVAQEKSGGVCGEGLGAEFEHAFYDFLQFRKVFFAGVEDNDLVGLVGFEDDAGATSSDSTMAESSRRR